MCLGVPGRVASIEAGDGALKMGKVSFGGILKEVCLAYVPDVQVGDYVIVHAGFALNRLDEEEAQEVFDLLDSMAEADAATVGVGREGPAGTKAS